VKNGAEIMIESEILYFLGAGLLLVGLIITFVAIVLLFVSGYGVSRDRKEEVRGGGVVIVGLFPIVFGTDKSAVKTVLLLSIALTMLLIVVSVMSSFLSW
jgi:uncharacterized protein (TIGR00304 family)